MFRRALFVWIAIFTINYSYAQDSIRDFSVETSLDVLSDHLWRGFENGNSVSLQPSVTLSYKNFGIGAWTAWAVNDSYYEFDWYAMYNWKNLNVTLYDYYCPGVTKFQSEMFNYESGKTKHTLDLNLTYRFSGKIPFRIMAATMMYGDDKKENGDSYYSTYLEAGLPFSVKKAEIEVIAGATPCKSYYAGSATFINLGVKAQYLLKIGTHLNIPTMALLSYNPEKHKFYFSAGLRFTSNLYIN